MNMEGPSQTGKDPMLDLFVFEAAQLLDGLEEILLESEESHELETQNVDEIFRIMHTIKGSAAMMMVNNVSAVAHAVEDLFDYIRDNPSQPVNYSDVCDLVLSSSDFIKEEIAKIVDDQKADGDETELLNAIKGFLAKLKTGKGTVQNQNPESSDQTGGCCRLSSENGDTGAPGYIARVHFEDGCQMENMRAFSLLHSLEGMCTELYSRPSDILEDAASSEYIAQNGLEIYFSTGTERELFERVFQEGLFVDSYTLTQVDSYADKIQGLESEADKGSQTPQAEQNADTYGYKEYSSRSVKQSLVSVNIAKMDSLMDLVGEIVITESMVVKSPDLEGMQLENFKKAATQLQKLTDELQDVVMTLRMVPVAATFNKMHRIVRDMGKKLEKDAELIVMGAETEVDKRIIDNLSDPLMHIVRNAMDHGIEDAHDRAAAGKPARARIVLEAKNSGGDVIINVTDDGKGLERDKILEKARERGLLNRPEADLTDREVFSFILLPGFSTNNEVTEYSGRGVGLDVVKKNIEQVGGSVSLESTPGKRTTVSIRIPLTLAIVDGMLISVGHSIYTIPTVSIRETFKANLKDVIYDTDGNELIMIRGQCYPIVRVQRKFKVETPVTDLDQGIMVMIEWDGRGLCLFADELIGVQKVVVKPIPPYLVKFKVKQSGIGGCTILGDGGISLILDAAGMINSISA